ncbi:MAG: 3-oxoacid CoA-transferase subunit B [Dehalococcoidia bacterium]|nr:3-oxoacid CoA-transferase subunit B [Dehalococcoidia bacterium]
MVAKYRMDEQTMALRVAKEFQDGMVINVGVGIGTQCINYVPEGREVLFQIENGALGFGPIVSSPDEADIDLLIPGMQPVYRMKGMSFFSQDESFAMIRGKHINMVVLGAMEVSEKGDLANWALPGRGLGNIGGSMDLALGAKRVVVIMTHTTKSGKPKILKKCTLPLTAPECVKLIVTDIAVIEVTNQGLVLKEVVPGWTAEEIQALTEPKLVIAPDLKEVEL